MNDRAQQIFEQTVDLSREARSQALREQCGDDSQLRGEVESLFSAYDKAGEFMSEPTLDRDAYSAPAEEAGTTIGRYKLLEKIGQGGFGDVFMAQQIEPVKRRVALKIIKLGMDTKQVIARFEAERQALALMDHLNIAKVLDGGQTASGRPYFVMELVRGDPITEYCDRERVPTAERLTLFQQVCVAIQHAHQKGVIHRDIKPSNVLVTVADGKPLVKVIDFGIAKATNTELTDKTLFTEFRQLIGTPQYMSPEQAERSGVDIDTRSDVYSLGVLLYEMLTGCTPVDLAKMKTAVWEEVQRAIREDEPTRPSTLVTNLGSDSQLVANKRGTDVVKLGKDLKGDLDWIVLKALEKDRTRRYGTATELADDVQRYLDDDQVSATPPSVAYKLTKLFRKNRVALGVVAAIAASLLLGIITTSWIAVRANRAEKRALRMAAMVATNKFEDGAERELVDAWSADLSSAEKSGEFSRRQILEQKSRLAVWWFQHGGHDDAAKMLESIYDDVKRELGLGHSDFTPLVNANIVSHIGMYDAKTIAELFGDLVDSMRQSDPENFAAILPQYAASLGSAGRVNDVTATFDEYLAIRNGKQPNPSSGAIESLRLASALKELEDWGKQHPERVRQLMQLRQTLLETGPNLFSTHKPNGRVGSRQIWEGELDAGTKKTRLKFNIFFDGEGNFSGEVINHNKSNSTRDLVEMTVGDDGKVRMEFAGGAKFEGTPNSDNTVCKGAWIQDGKTSQLTISRVSK